MNTNTVMVILVIALVISSGVQALQINKIKKSMLGIGGTSASGGSASGGETYDEMMARMHPDQAKSSQSTRYNTPSQSMVGGC